MNFSYFWYLIYFIVFCANLFFLLSIYCILTTYTIYLFNNAAISNSV